MVQVNWFSFHHLQFASNKPPGTSLPAATAINTVWKYFVKFDVNNNMMAALNST
jgi:hypothetical protein